MVGPFFADSAKSHHGCFSRVQKANGIANRNNIIIKVHYHLVIYATATKYLPSLNNQKCDYVIISITQRMDKQRKLNLRDNFDLSEQKSQFEWTKFEASG